MNLEAEIADLKRRETASEHRIKDLESEMKDSRELIKAVAILGENVDTVKDDLKEVKGDIKKISEKPSRVWERVVTAVISAAATALAAALLAVVLK